jgi:hypothetical protein
MQSSNSGGLMSTQDSGEGHDTLYAMTCKPADLRPRLTLLVRASTTIFLVRSCWSADEKCLSAKIELR